MYEPLAKSINQKATIQIAPPKKFFAHNASSLNSHTMHKWLKTYKVTVKPRSIWNFSTFPFWNLSPIMMVSTSTSPTCITQYSTLRGQRDGSVVKSTCCSCRGSNISPQHPQESSQLSYLQCQGMCHPLLISMSTRHTCGIHKDKQANIHTHEIKI